MTTVSNQLPHIHIELPAVRGEKTTAAHADTKTISITAELGEETYFIQKLKSLGKKENIQLFDTFCLLPLVGQIATAIQLGTRACYTTCNIKNAGEWLIDRDDVESLAAKTHLEDPKAIDPKNPRMRKAIAEYIKAAKLRPYKPNWYHSIKVTKSWRTICENIRNGKRFINNGQNRLVINFKEKCIEFSCPTSPSVVYPVAQAYFKSIGDKKQYLELTKLTKCMQARSAYMENGIHQVSIKESATKNGFTFAPQEKTVHVTVSDGHLCDDEIKISK